MSFEQFI